MLDKLNIDKIVSQSALIRKESDPMYFVQDDNKSHSTKAYSIGKSIRKLSKMTEQDKEEQKVHQQFNDLSLITFQNSPSKDERDN